MEPADIARVPGIHAKRVITLRGSTAVSGLEMITALRPPTRAVRDEASRNWVAGHNPGFAGHTADGPGAAGGHPRAPVVVDSGWNGGFLNEEAYQWVRDVSLLSDEECTLSYAVGSDLNTAFLAAPARLIVDLSTSDHFPHPGVQPKIPGSWLVDLSHVKADPRPPSPFTPDGMRPKGRPAWYQTHTVAYAQELGYNAAPLQAYLRRETSACLAPWDGRLREAYVDTLGDLGVTKELTDLEFLRRGAAQATMNGLLPLAVFSDCVVYPSPGLSTLHGGG